MTGRDPEPHPLELLVATLLGGALLIGLWAWATALVASAVFGSGVPDLSLAAAASALGRLPHHLSDPRVAYPPDARAVLPRPLGWWTAAVLTTGAAVAIGASLVALGRAFGRGPRAASAAAWGRGRDLRQLRVRGPAEGRLALGRKGSWLLAAERGQSVLVVAPTQTGKTTGLAIPAVLEWHGPVLATSIKTDLLRDTIDARRAVGQVQLFDPAGETLLPSASWSPLAACEEWAGARRTASWLAEGASSGRRVLADSDFWHAAAAKLLAPILFAAANGGASMADVITWIDTQAEATIMEILEATGNEPAINAMQASVMRDERQRSSIYTTAETILEAYADPNVLARSATSDIDPAQLVDGGSRTLYLSSTVREQRRLRPLFVTLIQAVVHAAYQRAAATGKPLDPPLLVVLDEAANIAPLPDLDILASTGAGHGVQLLTVLQDLAQAHDRWGRDRADTIVNNHRAKVIGAGISDQRTLEWLGRLLGDEELDQRSSTSGDGRRSVTRSVTYRSLAPGNVVRQGRPGTAVLIHGHLPPAWIQLRPWFRDRRLRELARVSGAHTSDTSRPSSR
jgi:type IV secretion system protein VirD4